MEMWLPPCLPGVTLCPVGWVQFSGSWESLDLTLEIGKPMANRKAEAAKEGLGEGEVRQVCPAQCNRGVFERGDLQQRLMEPQGWQRISKRYRHFYKGVSYS